MSRPFIPRNAQQKAFEFMLDVPRCNIWMDPGMGKTAATLLMLETLRMAGSKFLPALVIAPRRVARGVWPDETKEWTDFEELSVVDLTVREARRREKRIQQDALIYSINYENIPWLIEHYRKRPWPFGVVIADESTKLKNFRLRRGTKRAAALAKIAKYTGRWVNLTGTPSPNGLQDLWGQNWFVDKGQRLGTSYTDFKARFFIENKYAHTLEPRPFAEAQIMELIDDVTISLDAADYMDLPDTIVNDIPIKLPPRARELYDEFEKEMIASLDEDTLDAETAADASSKCVQLASGAFYSNEKNTEWAIVHGEKLEALRSLHSEIGEPLLVCYHFRHDMFRLLEAFPEARLLDTKQDEDDWNAGKIDMLLVHPSSAGHGLNLQHGGHHIAFFTNWWNLEDYLQVLERLGAVRQFQSGYDRPVFVHHLIASDTVEEDVVERRYKKRSVQDSVRARAKKKHHSVVLESEDLWG